mmetsp:Transcript_51054/g.119814  ORF Transcript_51054/g.119814 Transcript_51054/m.119814 type:complete len:203 (-) Transcript_51054:26-634(-)
MSGRLRAELGHLLPTLIEGPPTSLGRDPLAFFPVDNTQGPHQPAILRLRQAIEAAVLSMEHVRTNIPFQWLSVYDKLQLEQRAYMSLEEFHSMTKDIGLPTTPTLTLERECRYLLRFLTHLGVVMYNDDALLRHLVVLNPIDFLVAPATKLICQRGIHRSDEDRRLHTHDAARWMLLRDRAILDPVALNYLWSASVSVLITP